MDRCNRLLLVDGNNLLFQMFFGMPARIVNEQGKAIQGTLGFVGALLKIIRRVEPTHIAVLFDGEHENDRVSLDEAYKANRMDYSEVPEEEIVISSFDSDFFQLITDKVSVLRYRGEKTTICTSESLREKFGIAPGQYADFKSLTGDTADNIKGAEKVGAKTAAMLLNEFGTLENLLANAEGIKKSAVRESIARNAERLLTNYKLIKLGNTASLPFDMCELEFSDAGITTSEVLKGIGLK